MSDRPDDENVAGYMRPFHTHPHLKERDDIDGHAHPRGGEPHWHVTAVSSTRYEQETQNDAMP